MHNIYIIMSLGMLRWLLSISPAGEYIELFYVTSQLSNGNHTRHHIIILTKQYKICTRHTETLTVCDSLTWLEFILLLQYNIEL